MNIVLFFPQVEHVRAAEDAAQNVPGGTVETKKRKVFHFVPYTFYLECLCSGIHIFYCPF